MALCRSCQRDPDEWDREMRRLAGEADYYKRIARAYQATAESRLDACRRAVSILENHAGPEAYPARNVLDEEIDKPTPEINRP